MKIIHRLTWAIKLGAAAVYNVVVRVNVSAVAIVQIVNIAAVKKSAALAMDVTLRRLAATAIMVAVAVHATEESY